MCAIQTFSVSTSGFGKSQRSNVIFKTLRDAFFRVLSIRCKNLQFSACLELNAENFWSIKTTLAFAFVCHLIDVNYGLLHGCFCIWGRYWGDCWRNSLSLPLSALRQRLHAKSRVVPWTYQVQNRIENRNCFLVIKVFHFHSHISEKKTRYAGTTPKRDFYFDPSIDSRKYVFLIWAPHVLAHMGSCPWNVLGKESLNDVCSSEIRRLASGIN